MNYLVIPAYQPDFNLLTLIEKIHKKCDFSIIVIDDGSSPECQEIFARAENYGTVLRHQVNQGKGQALKTAFAYIQSLNIPGTIVTADADGQHKIWDILRTSNKADENPSTLVLGVRAFTGKVPLRSRFGNSLTRILFKIQTGIAVSDTQTGLRAFTTDLIPFMMEVEGQRYEYEMNMLLEASKQYSILEVPIETVYINDNQASHFRPFRDGLIIYKNIFKFALSSFSSFIVDYLVYALSILCLSFIPSGLRLILSNGLARVTSCIFNFSTNKKLVFKNKASNLKTGVGYLTLSLVLFFLDTLLISLFNTGFGINLFMAKIVVGMLLFVVSWTVQTRFIFKERICYPV